MPNEEVKKQRDLLATALLNVLRTAGMLNSDTEPNGAELIMFSEQYCQLFPQPITDEGLEGKVMEILEADYEVDLTKEDGARQAKMKATKCISALLQQRVEEAEKRGIDSGITAYESTCEGLIQEAKKQEREGIDKDIFRELQYIWFRKGKGKYDNGWNDCRQWVFNHCFDKMRQALTNKKEGE